MQKWKYRIFASHLDPAELVVIMNESGDEGWELVAVVAVTDHQPIELIEVDYPSASFGTQNLAPGADFHYRFKVLGSGSTKLLYTDSAHKDHKSDGPPLAEGAEGSLAIVIASSGVTWQSTPATPAHH